jgi:hypothetical protein
LAVVCELRAVVCELTALLLGRLRAGLRELFIQVVEDRPYRSVSLSVSCRLSAFQNQSLRYATHQLA